MTLSPGIISALSGRISSRDMLLEQITRELEPSSSSSRLTGELFLMAILPFAFAKMYVEVFLCSASFLQLWSGSTY